MKLYRTHVDRIALRCTSALATTAATQSASLYISFSALHGYSLAVFHQRESNTLVHAQQTKKSIGFATKGLSIPNTSLLLFYVHFLFSAIITKMCTILFTMCLLRFTNWYKISISFEKCIHTNLIFISSNFT